MINWHRHNLGSGRAGVGGCYPGSNSSLSLSLCLSLCLSRRQLVPRSLLPWERLRGQCEEAALIATLSCVLLGGMCGWPLPLGSCTPSVSSCWWWVGGWVGGLPAAHASSGDAGGWSAGPSPQGTQEQGFDSWLVFTQRSGLADAALRRTWASSFTSGSAHAPGEETESWRGQVHPQGQTAWRGWGCLAPGAGITDMCLPGTPAGLRMGAVP